MVLMSGNSRTDLTEMKFITSPTSVSFEQFHVLVVIPDDAASAPISSFALENRQGLAIFAGIGFYTVLTLTIIILSAVCMGKRALKRQLEEKLKFPKRLLGQYRDHLKSYRVIGNAFDPQEELELRNRLGLKVEELVEEGKQEEDVPPNILAVGTPSQLGGSVEELSAASEETEA
jgi:hypothetical protein